MQIQAKHQPLTPNTNEIALFLPSIPFTPHQIPHISQSMKSHV